MRKVVPKTMKNSIYNAVVNSHLSYGISIWGGSAAGDKLNPLFVLQKRALRNLFGIRRVSKFIKGHTKQVFGAYNILTVYNIYNYMTVINYSKLIFQQKPSFLCKILHIDNYIAKPNSYAYLPKLKTNQFQNNFCYQGPKLWNLLKSSAEICNKITYSPNMNTLKYRLKSFLLKMQCYGPVQKDQNWYKFNSSIPEFLNTIKNDPYYKL